MLVNSSADFSYELQQDETENQFSFHEEKQSITI